MDVTGGFILAGLALMLYIDKRNEEKNKRGATRNNVK